MKRMILFISAFCFLTNVLGEQVIKNTITDYKSKNTKIIEQLKGNEITYTISDYYGDPQSINDEDLRKIISAFKSNKIESLYLESKLITRKGLDYLSEKCIIHNIYFSGCTFSGKDIAEFTSKMALKSEINKLKIENCMIDKHIFNSLSKTSSIKYIKFRKNAHRINDEDFELLSKHNTIQELELTETSITDDGLKNLKNMKNLSSFYITSDSIKGNGLNYIADIPMRANAEFIISGRSMKYDDLMKVSKKSPNKVIIQLFEDQKTNLEYAGLKFDKLTAHLYPLNFIFEGEGDLDSQPDDSE